MSNPQVVETSFSSSSELLVEPIKVTQQRLQGCDLLRVFGEGALQLLGQGEHHLRESGGHRLESLSSFIPWRNDLVVHFDALPSVVSEGEDVEVDDEIHHRE